MPLIDWIQSHEVLIAWMGGLGLLVFLGSLVAMPVIIVLMPQDYFVRMERGLLQRKPLRQVLHVFKNVLGCILLLAGIAMLVLPGQGLLTILIGLSLIDFPGKHGLQLRLVRIPRIRRSIQWIRHKAGRPPLALG
jgi:hypothetical protein